MKQRLSLLWRAVLAFVGIVGTVFKQPVSSFLATSGALAIVLGLALQSTLGDVLSGLAINIERLFGAGDCITLANQVSGHGASLLFLAFLGGLAARVGGALVLSGAIRVTFWGALAMAITAGVGALFGRLM